jgi:hypothetical protein
VASLWVGRGVGAGDGCPLLSVDESGIWTLILSIKCCSWSPGSGGSDGDDGGGERRRQRYRMRRSGGVTP